MGKRRKKGEGSVRQRKDGRWEGRVVIGYDEKGLPKTKNVLAKTKRECQEKLKQLRETVTGLRTEKVRPEMPFGEWLDFWYQNYVKPQIRPTTQANYEAKIYQHIIPELGKIPLNQLAQKDLQQFYARMKTSGRLIRTEQFGKGLSDSMVRGLHAACRSALEKAVQEELIRTNPAVGCKLPPKRGREMQVLGREELQRFLIQAQAEGYYELFLLDLCTGLRRGELLALLWDDLDFKTGTLTVNKQVYEVKGQLQVSVPKTRASIRRLVLPPGVVEVLRAYRETVDSRWMFPSPVKEDVPMTPGAVRRRLQIILERAGCNTYIYYEPPWTSTPTSPGICRPRRRPRSTGGWATRCWRILLRQSRVQSKISSRYWGESESRAPDASPRSMATCSRAATPPPGRTAPSIPNASTPTPGRRARRS